MQYAVHAGDFDDGGEFDSDNNDGASDDWAGFSPLRLDDGEMDEVTAEALGLFADDDDDESLLLEYFKKLTYYIASEPEGEVRLSKI